MAIESVDHPLHATRKTIVLIGYRGTGKSTIASALAARLKCAWVDTDEQVEQHAGKTIAAIFSDLGESGFRDLEAMIVRKYCHQPGLVIATGGGAILREANRHEIQSCDAVIWLTASPETISQRLLNDPTTSQRRPQLTDQNFLDEIKSLLALRMPSYEQCATLTVNTEAKNPQEITDEILAGLGK